jgi:hypothetical protein
MLLIVEIDDDGWDEAELMEEVQDALQDRGLVVLGTERAHDEDDD